MNCGGSCGLKTDFPGLSPETIEKTNRHPCFSYEAHKKFARMHLPVAPRCNIGCNYCNRKFDCVHESRPGVTSEVLTPEMAFDKYRLVKERIEQLSVVGIAGPGDALANWHETKKSIELIREYDPAVIFCLSTNGLLLPEYAQDIAGLGINHVTVTLNTLDPEIGAEIYRFINYKGRRYEGVEGAGILLENQLVGIKYLASAGIVVKVNIVMIEGVNDGCIPDVVKEVKELGAFITNIMPLIPAPGSVFENYPQTSMKELSRMRDICRQDLQQMRHCRQCRADAIGLLEEDRSLEFSSTVPQTKTASNETNTGKIYQIAVATKYGYLVDQHFGHASEFAVYRGDGCSFELIERRSIEKYCSGMAECDTEEDRKDAVIAALKDCDAVLTLRIGYAARKRLEQHGIRSVESCETVENGLIYAVKLLNERKKEIA